MKLERRQAMSIEWVSPDIVELEVDKVIELTNMNLVFAGSGPDTDIWDMR